MVDNVYIMKYILYYDKNDTYQNNQRFIAEAKEFVKPGKLLALPGLCYSFEMLPPPPDLGAVEAAEKLETE